MNDGIIERPDPNAWAHPATKKEGTMDTIDQAQAYDALYQQSALSAARNRTEDEEPLIINGVRCCLDCEIPIPKARLEHQPTACRCVKCQEKKEKKYGKSTNI